jgi:hypothetical protein
VQPDDLLLDKSIEAGHCMDRLVLWFANAGVNVTQDITILLLPMHLIQTLQSRILRSEACWLCLALVPGRQRQIIQAARLS